MCPSFCTVQLLIYCTVDSESVGYNFFSRGKREREKKRERVREKDKEKEREKEI
jgi:hypothetical protein